MPSRSSIRVSLDRIRVTRDTQLVQSVFEVLRRSCVDPREQSLPGELLYECAELAFEVCNEVTQS